MLAHCGLRRWQWSEAHRGEREISCKPSRGEGRLLPPVPVVNAPRATLSCAGTPGACGHPAFPAPSSFERDTNDAKLGREQRREKVGRWLVFSSLDQALLRNSTRPWRPCRGGTET